MGIFSCLGFQCDENAPNRTLDTTTITSEKPFLQLNAELAEILVGDLLARAPAPCNWAQQVSWNLNYIEATLTTEQCHLALFSGTTGFAYIMGHSENRSNLSFEHGSRTAPLRQHAQHDYGSLYEILKQGPQGPRTVPILLTKSGEARLLIPHHQQNAPGEGTSKPHKPAESTSRPIATPVDNTQTPQAEAGAARLGDMNADICVQASMSRGDLLALPVVIRGRLVGALLLGWGPPLAEHTHTQTRPQVRQTKRRSEPGRHAASGGPDTVRQLSVREVRCLERLSQLVSYGLLAQPEQAAFVSVVVDLLAALPLCGNVQELLALLLAGLRDAMAVRTALDLTPLLALTHGSSYPAALISARHAAGPRAPADLPPSQARSQSLQPQGSRGSAMYTRHSYPPAAVPTLRGLVAELYHRRISRLAPGDGSGTTATVSGYEGLGGHRAASGRSTGSSWPSSPLTPVACASKQPGSRVHSPLATTTVPAAAAAGAAAGRSSRSTSLLTSVRAARLALPQTLLFQALSIPAPSPSAPATDPVTDTWLTLSTSIPSEQSTAKRAAAATAVDASNPPPATATFAPLPPVRAPATHLLPDAGSALLDASCPCTDLSLICSLTEISRLGSLVLCVEQQQQKQQQQHGLASSPMLNTSGSSPPVLQRDPSRGGPITTPGAPGSPLPGSWPAPSSPLLAEDRSAASGSRGPDRAETPRVQLGVYLVAREVLPGALLQVIATELEAILELLLPAAHAVLSGQLAVEWAAVRSQLLPEPAAASLAAAATVAATIPCALHVNPSWLGPECTNPATPPANGFGGFTATPGTTPSGHLTGPPLVGKSATATVTTTVATSATAAAGTSSPPKPTKVSSACVIFLRQLLSSPTGSSASLLGRRHIKLNSNDDLPLPSLSATRPQLESPSDQLRKVRSPALPQLPHGPDGNAAGGGGGGGDGSGVTTRPYSSGGDGHVLVSGGSSINPVPPVVAVFDAAGWLLDSGRCAHLLDSGIELPCPQLHPGPSAPLGYHTRPSVVLENLTPDSPISQLFSSMQHSLLAAAAATAASSPTSVTAGVGIASFGGQARQPSADLQALRLFNVVGRGSQGMVLRGLWGGLDTAVKCIRQRGQTEEGMAEGGGGGGEGGAVRAASEQQFHCHRLPHSRIRHLRNAVELAVSASVAHPHIVQVYTLFMDVAIVRDQDSADCVCPLRLLPCDHPALQQTKQPVALFSVLCLEYCDAGTLLASSRAGAFLAPSLSAGLPTDLPAGAQGRGQRQGPVPALVPLYTSLLEVALALRHLHGKRLVHGDVKPANVLLKGSVHDPRGWVCKLGDFGCSRLLNEAEVAAGGVSLKGITGTPAYMAPELLTRGGLQGFAADIYAFGIMMWELLVCRSPYAGVHSASLVQLVVRQGLRPTFPQWPPADYCHLACLCWSRSPAARPTADQLVEILQLLLQRARAEVDVTPAGGPQPPQTRQHLPPQPPAAASTVAQGSKTAVLRPSSSSPAIARQAVLCVGPQAEAEGEVPMSSGLGAAAATPATGAGAHQGAAAAFGSPVARGVLGTTSMHPEEGLADHEPPAAPAPAVRPDSTSDVAPRRLSGGVQRAVTPHRPSGSVRSWPLGLLAVVGGVHQGGDRGAIGLRSAAYGEYEEAGARAAERRCRQPARLRRHHSDEVTHSTGQNNVYGAVATRQSAAGILACQQHGRGQHADKASTPQLSPPPPPAAACALDMRKVLHPGEETVVRQPQPASTGTASARRPAPVKTGILAHIDLPYYRGPGAMWTADVDANAVNNASLRNRLPGGVHNATALLREGNKHDTAASGVTSTPLSGDPNGNKAPADGDGCDVV